MYPKIPNNWCSFIIILSLSIRSSSSKNNLTINILLTNEQAVPLRTLYSNVENSDIELHSESDRRYYQFKCQSKYSPVIWTYEGEGLPSVTSSSSRREANLDDHELFATNFVATLFLKGFETNTGKYICNSVDANEIQNYVYIYIPGRKMFIIDTPKSFGFYLPDGRPPFSYSNEIQTELTLDISGKRTWVWIPCAISNPNATVSLFKDEENLSDIFTPNSLKYNPKKGFYMNTKRMKNPCGFYTCVCAKSISHPVIYKPTRNSYENSDSVALYFHLRPLKNDSYIEVGHLRETQAFSCNSSHHSILYGKRACYSFMDCHFLKLRLRNSYLPLLDNKPHHKIIVQYRLHNIFHNPNEVEWINKIHPNATLRPLPLSGLFFCTAGRNNLRSISFSVFQDEVITNLDNYSPNHDNGPHIYVKADGQNETSVEYNFICYGRSLFYSHGFVWAVEKPDGELKYINGDETERHSAWITSSLNVQILRDEIGQQNNFTIVCYAPIWNSSTIWDKTTYDVEIENSFSIAGLLCSSRVTLTVTSCVVLLKNMQL